MTFFQPITLASEFIQHVIVIVLAGLVLTECVACFKDLQMLRKGLFDIEQERRFRVRKREHLQLLSAVILSATWLIVEYFADLSHVSYHFLFHAPIIFVILWLLRQITRSYRDKAIMVLFFMFLTAASGHIFLDVLKFLLAIHVSWDSIARALFKTAEAITLYFLVIRYLIISKNDDIST